MIQDDQDHRKTGAWRERLIASHVARWDERAMITADGRPQVTEGLLLGELRDRAL
ncbi:MAG: hypothetical protein KGS44_07050 [Alphaproteobacteria bacterium]|jgi:hypothetical protein|nr:hypothetical protein [Alphaproteobacteria bacterium]